MIGRSCEKTLKYLNFGLAIVVDIIVDAAMADFVGSFDDFFDVVGNFIEFAIGRIDSFVSFLHFAFKPMIEWLPIAFANKKDWHFGHFAFFHQK